MPTLTPSIDRAALLEAVAALVRRAGDEIMRIYGRDFAIESKADDSPLTEADLAAHHVLVAGLEALQPSLPVLSEESAAESVVARRSWPAFWLVDPLDGTKEFIARNGEFTVNVALVEGERATLGCVGVPARGDLYLGDTERQVAQRVRDGVRTTLRTRRAGAGLTAVASRRHGGERLASFIATLERDYGAVDVVSVGSALKVCLVAEGSADLYPRLGPTSEWDIAAADAVLVAAGGAIYGPDGGPLRYNKEDILNPDFLAVGDPDHGWQKRLPL